MVWTSGVQKTSDVQKNDHFIKDGTVSPRQIHVILESASDDSSEKYSVS